MPDMTLPEQIELACLMEATARKPGNVHPGAAFDDLRYEDFVVAARVIGTPLATARTNGVGRSIYDAIQATRNSQGTNVNLGIVLLLAPFCAVKEDIPLDQGLSQVLQRTTLEDAEHVYAAIRLAHPGGIGRASSQDISMRPTVNLRDAMVLAADRDRVAEQYLNGFRHVFESRQKLCELIHDLEDWEAAIISLYLWMLAKWPDTLIVRKCGLETAELASSKAAELVDRAAKDGKFEQQQLDEFDTWLRADGHRRNPGTTADLIAATLFAALRDGLIAAPPRDEIQQRATSIQQACCNVTEENEHDE